MRQLLKENFDSLFELKKLDCLYADICLKIEQLVHQNPWSHSLITSELNNQNSYVYGYFFQEELVAYCFTQIVVDELHILNLAVSKEWQGNGIAQVLLEKAITLAKEHSVKNAFLEVRESNQIAQHVYEKLNFKCQGKRIAYYKNNNENALLYHCILI